MKHYIIIVLCLLAVGCAKKSDLDDALNKVTALEQQLITLRTSNANREESLTATISRLESNAANLQSTLNAQFSQRLSAATNTIAQQDIELKRYRAYFERQKELALANENKKKDMLENIKQANQAPGDTFRVFDILHVGNKVRNGVSDNYGRFSIRNYTNERLSGVASVGLYIKINIDVPPNSSSEPFYIRSDKKSAFTIDCNLGKKTYNWESNPL